MDIKAISFDLDGPLVYMSISVEQYLSNIYEKLGFHFGLEQVSAVYKEVHRWWKERFLSGQPRTHEAWIEYNCRLLEGLGAKGDLQGLSERVLPFWENYPESGNEKLYPEVKGVLRKLREKEISLAIVSQRPLPFSLKSLRKHGIKEYFKCMVSPEIAKAPKGKLSPEMWQFALRKLGVAPAEVLHVDDNHEWISGAKQAGIQPVLIYRKGTQSSTFDCVVIHDLTEIFELL
ncbi:MAG: HAD family hydrolase [Candidatus Bathyarchaeota archaeon]|nr:HAD family hydrolase [Candidatus Bathyarchaeota archaeon]MDH5687479.1 HAD family hydrolase [Candidatus Bathyarchaeota archaeon]